MNPVIPMEQQIVGMMGVLLILVGIVVSFLPVGYCSHCRHCRDEEAARAKKTQVTNCPFCRGMHAPGECRRDKAEDE